MREVNEKLPLLPSLPTDRMSKGVYEDHSPTYLLIPSDSSSATPDLRWMSSPLLFFFLSPSHAKVK